MKRLITLDSDSHAIALDSCLAGTHLMFKERVTVAGLVGEGLLHEIKVDVEPARLVLVRHSYSPHYVLLDKVSKAIQASARAILQVLEPIGLEASS